MAAFSLSDKRAAGRAQQRAQLTVELWSHSERCGFAQGGDLDEYILRFDVGMIVGQYV